MKALPLLGLLGGFSVSFLGWTWPPAACHVHGSRTQADAAAAVAYAALYPISSTPDPDIKPEPKDDGHPRDECPNGGWVTHGDGHTTRCPKCRPVYSQEELRRSYFWQNGSWWYTEEPADSEESARPDCPDGTCPKP